MNYKTNWQETKQHFDAWWKGENADGPLMRINVRRDKPLHELVNISDVSDASECYLNVERKANQTKNYYAAFEPIADSYPNFDLNIGAGSLALYLGCEPKFTPETVWYLPCIEEYGDIVLDKQNKWYKKHIEMLKQQVKLIECTDIMGAVPDIIENIDILSAMRDPQETCFDLYDQPDAVKKAIRQINDAYIPCYDDMYNILKGDDGYVAWNCFSVMGKGKTAKVQCDMCAMLSKEHFDEFVLDGLRQQTAQLDNAIYHLDGEECFQHLPSLLSIEGIKAIQWTPGDGSEQGGSEHWFPLYDKIREAGKSLWIEIPQRELIEPQIDNIIKRYGSKGIYFVLPELDREFAQHLLKRREAEWRK